MNILNIIKIVFYIGIVIGSLFIFEQLYYMNKFFRCVVPFVMALLVGLGLHFIMGEAWYISMGIPFAMLLFATTSSITLFGDNNEKLRKVLIIAAIVIVLGEVFVSIGVVKLTENNDPRIAQLNQSINCYRGKFEAEGYTFSYKGKAEFSVEDYPEPYYFSYVDVTGNSDNSTGIGLSSVELPCLPTKENLAEIKTLVYAVKINTVGAGYEKYRNGVKIGNTTLYNSDICFLILNLDTKECYDISCAIYGENADYDEKQPMVNEATAKNYIKKLYKRYDREN